MLPKNAYRSVQEAAENIRNCSVRINKIFARHNCAQISVISILIPGATPVQNRRVNSPPHREAGGGFRENGPQQDHRTESDFPASCTQRTIEMRHEQIVPRHHAHLPLKRLGLSGRRTMLRMHRPKVMTPTTKASRSDTTIASRCRNRVPPRSAHGTMIQT
jgi:hypothetical protein